MPGLVHLIVATLPADAPDDGAARAVVRAEELQSAPGVLAVLIGRSDERLVVATWLTSREALEQFAASTVHMAFIMQGLAPVIRGMWSAAIETDASPPAARPAHLWAFALPEREGVYEWQVRQFLDEVEALPGAVAAAGPTFEERERFRAGGVACVDDASAFAAGLTSLRGQWGELLAGMQDALVPLLPQGSP